MNTPKVSSLATTAMTLFLCCAFLWSPTLTASAAAEEVRVLDDFETPASLKAWEFRSGEPELTTEHATHGRRALKITFDPRGAYHPAYIYWKRVPRDWSPYDALVVDVFNPNPDPIPGYVLIADQAWRDKGSSYWNRHNASRTFAPGLTHWIIPVRGLYRGEAGSRNNDIKRNIDPDQIVRLDFGFGRKGSDGAVILDCVRFVKSEKPPGVWAFDFGPPSQSVMLGWTPVTFTTKYARDRGYGWANGTPWNGAARDTTFGTAMLQDFCEAKGYIFRINALPGKHRALVFFENSGYWGGEQAQQKVREIYANGRLAWKETRPDGAAHALYRFENVEPVGVDIWDVYMKNELAKPADFMIDVGRDGLSLRFFADRPWGCKIAGILLYRTDDAHAAQWVKSQLEALRKEFLSKAVCLDKPANPFVVPPAWKKLGLVAWATRIEETIQPNTTPKKLAAPAALRISRLAVCGEFEPFCLAIRPLRNLGRCELRLAPFDGPSRISAVAQVVHYNTSRGFNSIAYHIMPHTLREESAVFLPKNVTREIVTTVHVPSGARPGVYRSRLSIQNANGLLLTVPLTLRVSDVRLNRETDYLIGFFGLLPPRLVPEDQRQKVFEETLAMLRDHGANAVSGGPSWRLTGWKNSRPIIDFDGVDKFFASLRKYGFTKPINGYGGLRFRGLHDRYVKGSTGAAVEKTSGLPFPEALMRAWGTVADHARKAHWPTIFYAMCDETRVRDLAERELAFMKMMARVSRAYPDVVRTSGSYSVTFRKRPTDKNDMLYWRQRFFEALDISSLNQHDPTVMAEAKKLGKEIHIYNQGRSRYIFGLYQWSEHRKGVRAFWQWHLNILHGYQFFDLDGREPDTAMICYGRKCLYPTIYFERCREGAEDFYLCNTLWKLAEKNPSSPAARKAKALLEGMVARVKLNQRQPPADFDADDFKAKVVEAIEKMKSSP